MKQLIVTKTISQPPAMSTLAMLRHDYHPKVYGASRLEFDPWNYPLALHDPPIAGEAPNAAMGTPETIRAKNADEKIYLTENIQWWLFELFYRNAPQVWKDEYDVLPYAWKRDYHVSHETAVGSSWLLKKFNAYLGGTIAFTNFGGSQNRACYPTHANIGSEDISAVGAWCGGATAELMTGRTTYRGEGVYGIRAVNVLKLMPIIDSMPSLDVFYATIIRRQYDSTGKNRKVIGFPYLDGNSCPFAGFMNDDIAWIEANRIEILPEGAGIQNPYNL